MTKEQALTTTLALFEMWKNAYVCERTKDDTTGKLEHVCDMIDETFRTLGLWDSEAHNFYVELSTEYAERY
jgi:hypothetical protein